MLNFIQFLMRIFGLRQQDILEKVFKRVVLSKAKTAGSKNPLDDLMGQFQDKGLGDVFKSWVGKGPNTLISADDVRRGLGEEKIAAMAAESGLPPDEVAKRMATLLPTMVDRATPNGEIPRA
jgi:uncharacterized protein YidB (DUF937 family)